MTLKPFFYFYGGKYRIAPRYPAPVHDTIIEPFAGSAGYAVRHHTRKVRLYDLDEIIVGVWDYLIHAPAEEIMALPVDVQDTRVLNVPQEARWLIGFWLALATTPRYAPTSWARSQERPDSFWGPAAQRRIAAQVSHIRHWTVACKSWQDVLDAGPATWFIDPPYHKNGKHYRYNGVVDDPLFPTWCATRPGQVIVCEEQGATWLPFRPFCRAKAAAGSQKSEHYSDEVIWTSGCDQQPALEGAAG